MEIVGIGARPRSAAQITASSPAGALVRSPRSSRGAEARRGKPGAESCSGARRDGSGVAKISVKRRW